ncbi:MAG: molecular chaperone HtpG [Lachnospiraceae bacterium]|nr:molecular chaperone HtpG [Lachnospiraceae bacterium]
MDMERGNLSINSENIFPIIKKWMYSDQDIFIREMVSNATDAITKRKKLDAVGEAQLPDGYKPEIHVVTDDKEKTLKFIDNGVGMTADEVKKDITEIAFSGATEFLEKYKDKADQDQIIGHFGLGFYSAFMVADQVDIDTLSFQEGAKPVHWECDGSTDYAMGDGDRAEAGTTVTLHLNEDCLQYANEYKVREILEKYCSFMPVPIYLEKEGAEPEYETIDEKDLREDDEVIEHITVPAKTEEREDENGVKEVVETEPEKKQVKIKKRPVPVNDTNPLWAKQPSECTDEEYKEFYRHVFLDYKEPLFWIHLNMDYPFNLKGILYFPRINTEYDRIEGTIKLYNNQVFVADNIKEVIPEYLMLLKGVIDCPDFPLNVSRSALQNDGFVKKISDYIAKKVADKLSGMCRTDRENYEKYWDDLAPFIKYGCIRDEKFNKRMKDFVLFKNLDDKYLTLEDCIRENKKEEESGAEETKDADASEEKKDAAEESADAPEEKKDAAEESADAPEEKTDAAEENADDSEEKEPEKTTIYYVTDPVLQSQYINMFRAQGKDAVILNHVIDNNYITFVERNDETVRFQRIDAEVGEDLKEDGKSFEDESKELQDVFRKALDNDQLNVKVEQLRDEDVSAMVTLSEQGRRMAEMMKMYGMKPEELNGMQEITLVLNAKHPVVQYVYDHREDADKIGPFCRQLFDLAMIANGPLMPEQMTDFVKRTNEMMIKLAD